MVEGVFSKMKYKSVLLLRLLFNKVRVIVRMFYYRKFYKWGHIGRNVYIGKNVIFQGDTRRIYLDDNVEIKDNCVFYFATAKRIHLAKNVSLERFNVINIRGELYIGENSMTAPFVSIVDSEHNIIGKKPVRFSGSSHEDIYIDRDVWIGTGAVILKGVRIGEGAVIGANAVVNRSVEPFTIVAGVPAKVIKKRKDTEEHL